MIGEIDWDNVVVVMDGVVVAGVETLAALRGTLADPSDTGIEGAIPLPLDEEPHVVILSDAEWAEQNKKINDLLAGRKP